MKAAWTFIAGVCLVAAAVALWRQQLSAAFVIATVGLMAWFLRYRSEIKRSLAENGLLPGEDAKSRETTDENDEQF